MDIKQMIPTEISDDQADFYRENGYLIVRQALSETELGCLRDATAELVAFGSAEVRHDPDFMYGTGHRTGGQVLRRIEYVVDKRDECKVLLGNPFILRSVERLMGPDFFPTWDAMVLKMPGEGIIVPWHRDAGTDFVGDKPIFNVDFYLDEATHDNCVWVIPGSHRWDPQTAQHAIERLNTAGRFNADGAVPATMQPGDVLFHDILVLHGSPASTSSTLRRVIYYEFRTAHVEDRLGPHVPAYIPLKQKVLLACMRRRSTAPYTSLDETPFTYRPPAPYNGVSLAPGEEPPTYRYQHREYWRG